MMGFFVVQNIFQKFVRTYCHTPLENLIFNYLFF
jgi:hypothetical protein